MEPKNIEGKTFQDYTLKKSKLLFPKIQNQENNQNKKMSKFKMKQMKTH